MRRRTKLVFFLFYGWTTAEQMCASCVNEGPSVGKVSVLESVGSAWETEQKPGAADRTAGQRGSISFPFCHVSGMERSKDISHPFPDTAGDLY